MLKPVRLVLPLLALSVTSLAIADTHTTTDPRIGAVLTDLGKVRQIDSVALSPDGKHLVWAVDTNGKPGLVLADADGKNARSIGLATKPGACNETAPAWAPDSHQLAFLSNCDSTLNGVGGKQSDIYVLDTQEIGRASCRERVSSPV